MCSRNASESSASVDKIKLQQKVISFHNGLANRKSRPRLRRSLRALLIISQLSKPGGLEEQRQKGFHKTRNVSDKRGI